MIDDQKIIDKFKKSGLNDINRFFATPEEFIFYKKDKISTNKTEKSHRGLVLRDVEVTRKGKKFTQKRWVKPGEDEPAPKKGKKIEDEPESKKDKKIEDDKSKESYKIGEQFNFLGNKYAKVEKVSESQKTVKLSDGLVYTFEAIEAGKKGISGGKYNIGDKINYKGENKTITSINMLIKTVELDNMGSVPFKDLDKITEKPKKLSVKDLKPIEKKPEIKKEKKIESDLPKNKSVELRDFVKSKKEANKFLEDNGWVWDKKSNIFPDVDDYDDLRAPTHIYLDDNGKIYGMAKFSEDYDTEKLGHIHRLEINSVLRGKGYGKKMMTSVISDLLKIDCDSVELDSLNENSNKFYRAIGMDEVTENGFYGSKEWMNIITSEK